MKLTRPMLLLATSSFVLVFAATRVPSQPVAVRKLVSVHVVTDRLTPISGGAVRVDNGTTQVVTVTDAEGQTPWLECDVSGGLELVLEERAVPSGIAVGMIEDVSLPSGPTPTDDYYLASISRTQPLAVPVTIEGAAHSVSNIFPPSGDWPHWMIAVPPASDLRFTAHVASLLDAEAISQFLAYRGVDPSAGPRYVRGVTLIVPAIQSAPGGFVVGIDLLGDLDGGVVIDAYNFAASPLVPIGPELSVGLLFVTNGIAYVSVNGALRKGHLALLARSPSGGAGTTHVLEDGSLPVIVPPHGGRGVETVLQPMDVEHAPSDAAQPVVAPVSASPSSAVSSSLTSDCEPPVPDQGEWTCEPTPPDASPCGTWAESSALECRIVRTRTPRFCKSPASTVQGSGARTATWKVSFKLSSGPGSSPLVSGGGFEYGESSTTVQTDTWTAQAGAHGLGQCMRDFRFELVCAKTFTSQRDTLILGEFGGFHVAPCSAPLIATVACRDTSISETVCDRTP